MVVQRTLVECPQADCGELNLSDSLFCDPCGTAMARAWRHCLELEGGDFRFELPRQPRIVRIGRPGGRLPPDLDVEHLVGRSPYTPEQLSVVSRLHAALMPRPDGTWALRDLGSTNGTVFNEKELVKGEERILEAGDRIGLPLEDSGSFHLVYRMRRREES